MTRIVAALALAFSTAAATTYGQTADRSPQASASATSEQPAESTYDRIWRFAEWYEDESNSFVQRVLFSGRYQHEFAAIGADQGDHDEWNLRRLRLGPRVTFFHDYTFHAEVELNPQERDPTYVRFTDFYVQWSRSRTAAVTVGKQGVPFTMDGATSSKELLTIDRSNLSNNLWFTYEYLPGVSVSGRLDRWVYRGGVYSSGAETREFGDFSGDFFTLALAGYDFGNALGVREALLTGNYVYQHPDAGNTFTRPFEHIASVNFKLETDRWGMRADVSAADGHLAQSDLRALMLMPFVNLTSRLQLVGRYTLVDSEHANGVRLATYENRVVAGRGDEYDELYLGANYYLYGHKLKLQTGLQWAAMHDHAADGGAYSGTSWTTGIRVGW